MSSITETLIDWYDFVFFKLADPRVKDWPLIGSPVYLLVIVALYLFFVLVAGPKFMENRRPYDLKKIIAVYNILQVLANAYLFYGTLTSGWTDKIGLGCYPIKYEDDPDLKLAGMVWKIFILKIVDLLDTIFFVLRKKSNQVTFLHVYHHVSTIAISLLGAKRKVADFKEMVDFKEQHVCTKLCFKLFKATLETH
uniref:Elongation of very long chain fatty acids protein n=1 Tax=Timema poppense TaxID=170557 RepID=A0A7R9DB18_TIMPO|nr:unnamed protein product [Timema poppensis]